MYNILKIIRIKKVPPEIGIKINHRIPKVKIGPRGNLEPPRVEFKNKQNQSLTCAFWSGERRQQITAVHIRDSLTNVSALGVSSTSAMLFPSTTRVKCSSIPEVAILRHCSSCTSRLSSVFTPTRNSFSDLDGMWPQDWATLIAVSTYNFKNIDYWHIKRQVTPVSRSKLIRSYVGI